MPPAWMQKLLRLLLPPACREYVLGDLQERSRSPLLYLLDALFVLPAVIGSRMRRTTDWQIFSIEVLTVYLAFSVRRPDLLTPLLLPVAIVAVGLLFCNAYADLDKPSLVRPILHSAGCIAFSSASQAILPVPFDVMLSGSLVGFFLLCMLRTLFPPQQARPKFAAIQLLNGRLHRSKAPNWNMALSVIGVLAVTVILFELVSRLTGR